MAMDDDELSSLIRRDATRHTAGAQLLASVRTQVMLAEAGRVPATPPAAPPPAGPKGGRLRALARAVGWRSGWSMAAAGFACGLLVAALAGPLWRNLVLPVSLENELVADHVRALQRGPLTEVASSDRHTVKPWFQGRLDYAPPVFDLAADGFPLLGGRVEALRSGAVAALAYTHNRHVLNLFVWPADSPLPMQRQTVKGFNVAHWADGGMQVWVVSDVDRTELERFTQAWRERLASQ
jgi:anti-sigma factor RsiW